MKLLTRGVDHDLECTYARGSPGLNQETSFRPVSSGDRETNRANPGLAPSVHGQIDLQEYSYGPQAMDRRQAVKADGSSINGHRQPIREQHIAMSDGVEDSPMAALTRESASDVVDINLYTNNLEFYGSASSVAFLRHVETLSNSQISGTATGPRELSLTSTLHNADFQPSRSRHPTSSLQDPATTTDRFHFRVARRFLDAYFSNIHYIQPLLDEEEFFTRCEDLWFNRVENQPLSFVALYYATLSLGSLVMTLDEPKLAEADRFEWSRKLFDQSLTLVTQLGTATDIEMVQCYYMLVGVLDSFIGASTKLSQSKICQHELNPHGMFFLGCM